MVQTVLINGVRLRVVQDQQNSGAYLLASVQTDAAGQIPLSQGAAKDFVAITKSDTTDLLNSGIRGLFVGGAGDVYCHRPDGTTTVAFLGVPAGTILPISPRRVLNATTATNIVGLL